MVWLKLDLLPGSVIFCPRPFRSCMRGFWSPRSVLTIDKTCAVKVELGRRQICLQRQSFMFNVLTTALTSSAAFLLVRVVWLVNLAPTGRTWCLQVSGQQSQETLSSSGQPWCTAVYCPWLRGRVTRPQSNQRAIQHYALQPVLLSAIQEGVSMQSE